MEKSILKTIEDLKTISNNKQIVLNLIKECLKTKSFDIDTLNHYLQDKKPILESYYGNDDKDYMEILQIVKGLGLYQTIREKNINLKDINWIEKENFTIPKNIYKWN